MAPATAPAATKSLPAANADGVPVVPMSDEQKYLFDLKGWITLPGLLDEAQLERIRAHQMQFLYRAEMLPPEERDNHGGPSQVLVDAPAVVGVLNEIISHQPLAAEDCYGFRFDHTSTSHRQAGHDNFNPHGGGGLFNFSGNSHLYQMHPGRVHAGLVRVVWELNEVAEGEGGTLFLSGSHKSAFARPESLSGRDSALWGDLLLSAGLGGDLYRSAVPHRYAVDQYHPRSVVPIHLLQYGEREVGKGVSTARGDRSDATAAAHAVSRSVARHARGAEHQQVP